MWQIKLSETLALKFLMEIGLKIVIEIFVKSYKVYFRGIKETNLHINFPGIPKHSANQKNF